MKKAGFTNHKLSNHTPVEHTPRCCFIFLLFPYNDDILFVIEEDLDLEHLHTSFFVMKGKLKPFYHRTLHTCVVCFQI